MLYTQLSCRLISISFSQKVTISNVSSKAPEVALVTRISTPSDIRETPCTKDWHSTVIMQCDSSRESIRLLDIASQRSV